MRRGYLIVEGHGDGDAALNILTRLAKDLGLHGLHWDRPIRGKNLHQERGVSKVAALIRSKGDAGAMLVLRDLDDGCPKEVAPQAARQLRALRLPFPNAIVLAFREFESLFLPCISLMAGKRLRSREGVETSGLLPSASFDGDPQAKRGVKEWLSENMPPGRNYKPTLDQLPLARLVEFETVRNSQPPLPFFGSLERALRFLYRQMDEGTRETYPS